MSITTIKVTTETRDRTSELAREKGLTANSVVEFLLEGHLWGERMKLVKQQTTDTSEDEMRTYCDEIALWDTASADGLADA